MTEQLLSRNAPTVGIGQSATTTATSPATPPPGLDPEDEAAAAYAHEAQNEMEEEERQLPPAGNAVFRPTLRKLSDYRTLTKKDPNALCAVLARGELGMFCGHAGKGKSTMFGPQFGIPAACGGSFFGMPFFGNYKVLLIGGENTPYRQKLANIGALEYYANKLTDEQKKLVDENYRDFMAGDTTLSSSPDNNPGTGEKFLAWLGGVLAGDPRDLVLIDPYAAFAGTGFTDQDGTSRFIRDGLQKLAIKHKCAIVCIHHFGKPTREGQVGKEQGHGIEYQVCGTSDMGNFFRVFVGINPTTLVDSQGKRAYTLECAKRLVPWCDADGRRASAEGTPYESLLVRHSPGIWDAHESYAWEHSPITPTEAGKMAEQQFAEAKARKSQALKDAKNKAKEESAK